MTKKFLLFALCLFILGTFISACGGGGKTTPPSYPFIPVPTPTPTVSPTPEPTPSKYPLELSQTEFTVNIGETDNITVTLNGEDITQTATYTVDQEAITTVEGGLITGISVGIATVTVNAENAESEKTFTVNVIDPTLPTLEVSPTEINLGIEEEATVTVTLEGEDVTEQVNYTSNKELIATAEKGVVKAGMQAGIENSPLVATITVSLEGANTTTFTVNVTDDSDNEVALNNDVLDKLHELGIIAKGSADKAELTEANIPAIFKYTDGTKYKITSIAEKIFKECTLLETVTIPDSVTTIGLGAFDSCTSLENVTIGNSVETIENGAFYNCSSLKEIIIPDSVTTINGSAFSSCSSLETVTIGNNVTTIGDNTFASCSLLKEIVIPDSVTNIGGGAFNACNSLERVIIGNGLTKIASTVFSNLSSLKTVTIGNNVETIESGAFIGCSSLEDVTIGNNVKTIEGGAFINCSLLKEIVIPNSVTTINGGAFSGCNSLETVTIGNGLTKIASGLFGGLTKLKTVKIGNGVKTIGDGAFGACTSLEKVTIGDKVETIETGAFHGCTNSDLTIAIPNSVTTIGTNAFYKVAEITYTSKMKATGSPWGAKKVNGAYLFHI